MTMRSYIRANFNRLKAEVEQEVIKSPAPPKPNALRPVKPLDVQITELMASLPPVQRDRKWSMAELVSRLEGRYRDKPHPQLIGEALRKLGWSSKRDWRAIGGGRRYWQHQNQSKLHENTEIPDDKTVSKRRFD